MAAQFAIAGTDTGVGKTVFAAALVGALDGVYWKPIQAGLAGETDSAAVRRLSGLPAAQVLPEAYQLRTPASPHIAAARDGIAIDTQCLALPQVERPLIVEGVGGLMVPLNASTLLIDVLSRWQAPVILCARTALGTINHSLLSVEALRRRKIPILGVVFIGNGDPDVEAAIPAIGGVRRLGRLPILERLDRETLRAAFSANFRTEDFS